MEATQLTSFTPGSEPDPAKVRPRWPVPGAIGLCLGLVLTGCSLHVSKQGVSGNVFGHSFSGAKGSLPAGFPSDVPTPDQSRVLAGGGSDNNWDVAFAVTGAVDAGTTAYQSKLQAAGYTISNVHTGTTQVTGSTGAASTGTTVTVTGSAFEAADAHWRMQVASGDTSSVNRGGLRAAEFGLNITVVPATSTPSSSP